MKKEFAWGMLFLSLLGAAVGLAVSEVIVSVTALTDLCPQLAMGIYYVLPMLSAVSGGILGTRGRDYFYGERVRLYCASLALVMVLGFLISFFAQVLYQSTAPRNAIILIDRSTSMDGEDRLTSALNAAKEIVENKYGGKNIKMGIVYFGDDAEVACRPTADSGALLKVLNAGTETRGTTDFDNAIDAALDLIGEESSAIFMVTDAADDVSKKTMDDVKARDTAFYAVKVGSEDDASTLKELARKTDGDYINVDTQELGSALKSFYRSYANLLINRPRSSDTYHTDIYYVAISAAMYVLLGAVMAAAYTLQINLKGVLALYNVFGGIAVALLNELNSYTFEFPFAAALLMLVLICPAVNFVPRANGNAAVSSGRGKRIFGGSISGDDKIIS